MNEELEAARTLAIRAGAILLDHFLQSEVQWKERGNPVTEADRKANAYLVGELRRLFPEDGILSEEEPDDRERLSKSRVWIVDPLDGTKEFIRRENEFAVMVGLAVEGQAVLGAVYQPLKEKLYYAAPGFGSFVVENQTRRPLQVSPESNPAAMTIALSRSHHSPDIEAIQREIGITHSTLSGSLGLKVGLICEGAAHVYVNTSRRTSQWDTCAPDAILREAGGRMTDLFNRPLRYNDPEVRNLHGVIASNGTIHDQIVASAQTVLKG